MSGPAAEAAQEAGRRLRECAGSHGLRLHRIHVPPGSRTAAVQPTLVLDCRCGQRWLLRVTQGEAVAVDGRILAGLARGREGQVTAPPGFAGLADEPRPAEARSCS